LHGTKFNFGGIYRAIIVDNLDPENFGRLRLQIPQVFGDEITDWVWSAGGGPRQGKVPYGAFSDYTTQTPAANTATVMAIGQTDEANEMSIVNGSRLVFQHSGTYNFQWSGQFSSTDNSAQEVAVWIRKNGTDVVGSTGVVTVPSKHGTTPGSIIAGWNFVFTVSAGEYVELWWHTTTTNLSLATYPVGTSPVHPSTASLVVTATLVGNYVPNITDGVWVAFEGGDPNFPVWIGTF
jgi:hypothetical protein